MQSIDFHKISSFGKIKFSHFSSTSSIQLPSSSSRYVLTAYFQANSYLWLLLAEKRKSEKIPQANTRINLIGQEGQLLGLDDRYMYTSPSPHPSGENQNNKLQDVWSSGSLCLSKQIVEDRTLDVFTVQLLHKTKYVNCFANIFGQFTYTPFEERQFPSFI